MLHDQVEQRQPGMRRQDHQLLGIRVRLRDQLHRLQQDARRGLQHSPVQCGSLQRSCGVSRQRQQQRHPEQQRLGQQHQRECDLPVEFQQQQHHRQHARQREFLWRVSRLRLRQPNIQQPVIREQQPGRPELRGRERMEHDDGARTQRHRRAIHRREFLFQFERHRLLAGLHRERLQRVLHRILRPGRRGERRFPAVDDAGPQFAGLLHEPEPIQYRIHPDEGHQLRGRHMLHRHGRQHHAGLHRPCRDGRQRLRGEPQRQVEHHGIQLRVRRILHRDIHAVRFGLQHSREQHQLQRQRHLRQRQRQHDSRQQAGLEHERHPRELGLQQHDH
ncbi:Uncharacterised protein [uncultured archaeon]|nr:Uncharacterised protein [uncultured archaeon]